MEVPLDERDAYECIILNKSNLRHFARQFQQSVMLFELLERGGGPPSVGVFGGLFVQYRTAAARDGALNIYHFKCALDALKRQLPTCQTVARHVDAIGVRDALKCFNAAFPNCDNVRNAVAHAAEIYKSPASIKKHSQKAGLKQNGAYFFGEGFSLFTYGLSNRTFSVGIEGDIFPLEIDQTSVEKLSDVIGLVDVAFQALSEQIARALGG